VSVVIPAYNRQDLLPLCLDSLKTQEYEDYEIIVVDDGSTDGTADAARRYPVRVIELGVNSGAGVARNAGVRAASGELIAFIDSDCTAPPDWISRQVRHMSGSSDHLGVTGTFSEDLGGTFISDFAFRVNRFKETTDVKIDTCNTSTFMCRRSDFLRVGGIPRFFRRSGVEVRGHEDAAFAFLLVAGGDKKIYVADDVKVAHRHRPDWLQYLRQQGYFSSRLGMHGVCQTHWFSDRSSFDRRGTVRQLLCLGLALASLPVVAFVPLVGVATAIAYLAFLLPQRRLIQGYRSYWDRLKATLALTAVSMTWGVSGAWGILRGFGLRMEQADP
jgi:O-antigen biosynthesis protein